jgi:2-haloacid dehalogenase
VTAGDDIDRAPVSAVVFDVGAVLFQWDLRHLFAKLVDDPAELDRIVTDVVPVAWHFQHDAGRSLAETLPERIALFPEYRPLIEAYAARFNETLPGPVPGSFKLVEALHARGVPLFALTNFGAEFWSAFRPTQPIFDLFADIVVSGVEKIAKPDPVIYELAQRRFGHDPHSLLFVDDREENIDAARKAGWQGHHFTDARTLETELRQRCLIA